MIYDLSEGIENCKMSGENQGKVREFEVNYKWQPCENMFETGVVRANEC